MPARLPMIPPAKPMPASAHLPPKRTAIGVRLKRWVSFHGISINVEPDLSHFDALVPCGVVDPRYGVTSLADLGHPVAMTDVDIALRQAFIDIFGAGRAPSLGQSLP